VLRTPGAVRWIVRTLEDAGFETWSVGGAVRDALLGEPSGDWDLTTRARPPDVRRVFRRTVPIGIEHGTVGVLDRSGVMYEVTTFRRDVETTGRHAVVAFADSLEEDLARRDFTINAVAWHPFREEIRDPFGGVQDMESRVLRTVGEPEDRFAEDYLRIIRALRFAGRYDLSIDPPTWEALCGGAGHLGILSAERVREELLKVVSKTRKPSITFGLMVESAVLAQLIPELEAGGEASPIWDRAMAALDAIPSTRPLLRLVAVLGTLGWGWPAEERPGRAAVAAAVLLERLRFSNLEVRTVGGLVEALHFSLPDSADPIGVRRWASRVGRGRLPDLIRVLGSAAEPQERKVLANLAWAVRRERRAGAPLAVDELAVDGRTLIRAGLRPGRRFGELLDRLLAEVLEQPSVNTEEWLVRHALEIGAEWGMLAEGGSE